MYKKRERRLKPIKDHHKKRQTKKGERERDLSGPPPHHWRKILEGRSMLEFFEDGIPGVRTDS